jgi:hypothetical protein
LPSKAQSPIEVMELGIITVVSWLVLNVEAAIDVNEFGIVTEVS